MQNTVFRYICVALLAVMMLPCGAQRVFDVNLWQGAAPHPTGYDGDTARLRVFLPASSDATGRAVVICPGGAYETLAMASEGYDWAAFLNGMGIAAIVLKYRMPHGVPQAPLSDVEQALRLVRANAAAWSIDAADVGVMGFSTGGHLASLAAVKCKGDARPDFQILFYPVITMLSGYAHELSHDNLLGRKAKKKTEQEYCSDMHVSRLTPPACIILCDDDDTVLPVNGVNYYTELYRHDVPASLFVFPRGGHGFGMKGSFDYHVEMMLALRAWLRSF